MECKYYRQEYLVLLCLCHLITQLKMVLAGVPEGPGYHLGPITIVGGGEKEIIIF